jgi:hypothetical protein
MFTTGRITFAIIFLISFVGLMIWSYGKDAKNHKAFYQDAAKKIGIYGSLVIFLFVMIRFLTRM